jgi:hypothetical protein
MHNRRPIRRDQRPNLLGSGLILPSAAQVMESVVNVAPPPPPMRTMRCAKGHEWEEPDVDMQGQAIASGQRCCPICLLWLFTAGCAAALRITPEDAVLPKVQRCPQCDLRDTITVTAPQPVRGADGRPIPQPAMARCESCGWQGMALAVPIDRVANEAEK